MSATTITMSANTANNNNNNNNSIATNNNEILTPEVQVTVKDLPITFKVKYLGSQYARGLWGIKHTRRPVDHLVSICNSRLSYSLLENSTVKANVFYSGILPFIISDV
nr:uncharacterized protein LOC115260232 [Aedes albopictus]